jgi:hypothetical protein
VGPRRRDRGAAPGAQSWAGTADGMIASRMFRECSTLALFKLQPTLCPLTGLAEKMP